MIKPIPLEVGQKYTIYTISESLAITQRKEVIVDNLYPAPEFHKRTSYDKPSIGGTWKIGGHRERRGRSVYHLTLRPNQDLVIPGWDHLESDIGAYGTFSGNACLNLAGTPEQVRELVELNINPNFIKHDIILAAPVPWTEAEYLEVYPDTPTNHGIITQKRAAAIE
jgi:hypothetical protein